MERGSGRSLHAILPGVRRGSKHVLSFFDSAYASGGIGRLAASEEFLAGLRSLVGPVTSPQLAAQLLRNYWGAQAGSFQFGEGRSRLRLEKK